MSEACPGVYFCFGDAHTRVSADTWLASAEPKKMLDFNQDKCVLCHLRAFGRIAARQWLVPPVETVARAAPRL